jgi:hypothetical protein
VLDTRWMGAARPNGRYEGRDTLPAAAHSGTRKWCELLRALANPPPPRAVLVLAAVIALFSSCVERMCGVHWLTLVLIPASTTSWGRTRSWPLHFIPHPPPHTHTHRSPLFLTSTLHAGRGTAPARGCTLHEGPATKHHGERVCL